MAYIWPVYMAVYGFYAVYVFCMALYGLYTHCIKIAGRERVARPSVSPRGQCTRVRAGSASMLHRIIDILWSSLAHENIVITSVIKLCKIMT